MVLLLHLGNVHLSMSACTSSTPNTHTHRAPADSNTQRAPIPAPEMTQAIGHTLSPGRTCPRLAVQVDLCPVQTLPPLPTLLTHPTQTPQPSAVPLQTPCYLNYGCRTGPRPLGTNGAEVQGTPHLKEKPHTSHREHTRRGSFKPRFRTSHFSC